MPGRFWILFDGLAAVLSVPALVFLSYFFGEHIDQLKVYIVRVKEAAAIIVIIAIIIWVVLRRWEHKKEDYYIDKEEEQYVEDEKG